MNLNQTEPTERVVKSFKDFNIELTTIALTGDSIDISALLNREIEVTDYRITPSKFPNKGNGLLLTLQFIIDDRERVLFTGSVQLQNMIKMVDRIDFPFSTIIVKKNMGYKFT